MEILADLQCYHNSMWCLVNSSHFSLLYISLLRVCAIEEVISYELNNNIKAYKFGGKNEVKF